MHKLELLFAACLLCTSAVAQVPTPNEALLQKARALYDAPFTRNLASFDCEVQFDWKKHFTEFTDPVPSALLQTADHLQNVQHRVFVDRSGATVSVTPKPPDLASDGRAAQLETALNAMITQGLNAWLPFSTNVILPIGPTNYNFQSLGGGYKLTMDGPGVAATLLLDSELRVTSGVVQAPQDLRFTTEFEAGPDGYLLGSVRTGSTTGSDTGGEATFSYTYQMVEEFQLPSVVTVSPATTKPFQFTLTGCKVVKFVAVHVAPPPNGH